MHTCAEKERFSSESRPYAAQKPACRAPSLRSDAERMKKQDEPGGRRTENSQNNRQKVAQHRVEVLKKAKEIVMKKYHMTESEAHRYIQKTAMDSRKGSVEVSEMIIVLYGDAS